MAARRYKDYIARWEHPLYKQRVLREAARIHSDGCSGVPDFYWTVCLEHDVHYATHEDFFTGESITQEDADRYLKWGIQFHSVFGRWSPMAWWRYWALSEKKGLGLGRQSWVTGPARARERQALAVDNVAPEEEGGGVTA
jgi:hypothetical protein